MNDLNILFGCHIGCHKPRIGCHNAVMPVDNLPRFVTTSDNQTTTKKYGCHKSFPHHLNTSPFFCDNRQPNKNCRHTGKKEPISCETHMRNACTGTNSKWLSVVTASKNHHQEKPSDEC